MRHLKRYAGRTVLVTTPAGAFRGNLTAATRDGVELDHVATVGPSGGPLDGTVFIPAASVAWAQVV